MAVLFKKSVKIDIDYVDTHTKKPVSGVINWDFVLDDESGAFEYGNHTYTSVDINGEINGEKFHSDKLFDTRYYANITNEKVFEEFCLSTAENNYGANAKKIELVK